MLLFLVYHANLPLNEICTLSKDAEQIFQGPCRMQGNNALALEYYTNLVAELNQTYSLKAFLFEDNEKPYSLKTIKGKIGFPARYLGE